MRRTIFALSTVLVVSLAVFALLVLRPVSKVKAHHGCSNRTLMGAYGVMVSANQEGLAGGPYLNVGLGEFDGNGNISLTEQYQAYKFQLSGPGSSSPTYDVNPDCSVTFTFHSGNAYGSIEDANGNMVDGVIFFPSTSPSAPNAAQGGLTMKRVWGFEDR